MYVRHAHSLTHHGHNFALLLQELDNCALVLGLHARKEPSPVYSGLLLRLAQLVKLLTREGQARHVFRFCKHSNASADGHSCILVVSSNDNHTYARIRTLLERLAYFHTRGIQHANHPHKGHVLLELGKFLRFRGLHILQKIAVRLGGIKSGQTYTAQSVTAYMNGEKEQGGEDEKPIT